MTITTCDVSAYAYVLGWLFAAWLVGSFFVRRWEKVYRPEVKDRSAR